VPDRAHALVDRVQPARGHPVRDGPWQAERGELARNGRTLAWAPPPPSMAVSDYRTLSVASDVSRATIEPPLSRASRRYETASALTRKPSRITGIPGG
jgi:hypothetical protein